ncbi:MAG: alkaline phosphatase D family protein [Schleiferiaceae bacterium]|nr:alkaline phosphatase D family protein [Schleiferiaceae bacterium]
MKQNFWICLALLATQSSVWAQFSYGVASGDPQSESLVIWTALEQVQKEETVIWEVAKDIDFQHIIASGSYLTSPDLGGTVKAIPGGLEASTTYFYRFWWHEVASAIGRSKTAPHPASTQAIRLGVVSCAHYEAGYFHGYAAMAEEKNIDAVIHLGDYIYEYGRGDAGWKVPGRLHEPSHEIVTLEDYRTRYAQYRKDPDLQAFHAAHPVIAIWDDHEIANNSFSTGAQNHQVEEGDYGQRRLAAMKAYQEWMPIRPEFNTGYRQFRFGSMVDLYMIETRLDGRSEAVKKEADRFLPANEHHMMSPAQHHWLETELARSAAVYRVIGNQVIFSELNLGIIPSDRLERFNLDAWDGYAAERDSLQRSFKQSAPVVILTGDSHCSWAFQGPGYVELCTPSITSINFNEFTTEALARLAGFFLGLSNRNLEYVDTRNHGYMLVDFDAMEARSEWVYVEEIKLAGPWRIHKRRHRKILGWQKNMMRR